MTGWQIIGVVILAVLFLVVVSGSSYVMVRQDGWKRAVLTWSLDLVFIAILIAGLAMAAGAWP